MKFLITSDWHLREGKPRYRKDDYQLAQAEKVKDILDVAKHYRAIILHGGDMTENFPVPKVSWKLASSYRAMASEAEVLVFTVFGQHDSNYHGDYENTPLMNMCTNSFLKYVNHNNPINLRSGIWLHGVSWNDEIPTHAADNSFNILIVHKMVSDRDYWSGHVNYQSALNILRTYPMYDLIVTGDNHHTFAVTYGDRTLINPGSLMRSSVNQVDHKPSYFIYDTETRSYEQHLLTVEPVEEVFDLQRHEQENSQRTENIAFIEELGRRGELDEIDFDEDLREVLNETQPKLWLKQSYRRL